MALPDLPLVAVIVPVRDADLGALPALVDELRAQRGVRLDLVLVDATAEGGLVTSDATVLRAASPSRGLAYRRGLEATDAPLVAWALPGTRLDPDRLARQARHLLEHPERDLVTANLAVRAGRTVHEQSCDGETPPALWQGTVCLRREVLERIDTTAFVPAELALLRTLRAEGRAAHLSHALVEADAESQSAATARNQEDAELLRLAAEPAREGPPEVTVFMATYDRCETLMECLEAFSRQLVAPGTHEIVVVSDGSRDRTPEVCAELELPVPFTFLHKENGGPSRARIHGLPHARGRLLLFVNDDTIPFPDFVQRHLDAHRELDDPRAMVLGTFEQPPEHLENALMRFLERTTYVFGYSEMCDGAEIGAEHLYTCNCSVSRASVEEVGGFDDDFDRYGGEDTEIGFRLEDAGHRLVYRAECRAYHRHLLSFDDVRRRQPLVSRSHTTIYAKHPRRLLGSPWSAQTRDGLMRSLRPVLPHLPALEAAGRTLAGVNLARLERVGGAVAETGKRIEERLDALFPKLNTVWWNLGLVEGFELHGISGFPEIAMERSLELPDLPRPVTLFSPDPFLATPWTEWVASWLAHEGRAGGTLLLQADPERGFYVDELHRAAGPLLERARREGAAAELAVVTVPDGADPKRLLASVDARVALPLLLDEEIDAFLQAAGAQSVHLDPLDPERTDAPWPLSASAPRRLLAWPDWSAADPEAWMAPLEALADAEDVVLVLRHDPSLDSPFESEAAPALARLGDLFAERCPDAALEVLVEGAPLGEREWRRLRAAVDAALLLEGDAGRRRRRLESLGIPTLENAEDVAAWRRGAEPAPRPRHFEALEAAHA